MKTITSKSISEMNKKELLEVIEKNLFDINSAVCTLRLIKPKVEDNESLNFGLELIENTINTANSNIGVVLDFLEDTK